MKEQSTAMNTADRERWGDTETRSADFFRIFWDVTAL
jgi:hypothetical protein